MSKSSNTYDGRIDPGSSPGETVYDLEDYRNRQTRHKADSVWRASEGTDLEDFLSSARPRRFSGEAIERVEGEAEKYRLEILRQAQREAKADRVDNVSEIHVKRSIFKVHRNYMTLRRKWREILGSLFLGGTLSQLMTASFWDRAEFIQATVVLVGIVGALLLGDLFRGD